MTRRTTVDAMMRQATLSDQQKARIHSAAAAFSLSRLQRMRRLGIRFWQDTGVAPMFDGWVEAGAMTTRAAYQFQVRTVRMRPNVRTDDLRHELAHAWDHVHGGRVSGNPERMNRRQRERMVTRPARMWSEASTRHRIGRDRFTVTQMLARYRSRARLREYAFDNPQTREGYSKQDVREFYAEGYSVLFGSSIDSQSKLWLRASELFEILRRDATAQGLTVPSETALRRYVQGR